MKPVLALPRVARGTLEDGACVRWTRVHTGSILEATRWQCRQDGEVMRAERCHTTYVLALLASGVCRLHEGTQSTLVDSASAILHRPDRPYRTTHPFGCNDAGWSFALRADVACEVLGMAAQGRAARGAFEVRTRGLQPSVEAILAAERSHRGVERDPLVLEERAIDLFALLFGASPPASRARRAATGARHRRLVERMRACLQASFREPFGLDAVASAAGVSPAHACRVFRAETGISIHAYRLRLRLGCALDALLAGLPVARAAALAGFSSHAHLTSLFGREAGRTPADLRARLRARH